MQLELALGQRFIKTLNQLSLESTDHKVSVIQNNNQKENFHEFFLAYTDILIKNVNKAKGSTNENLRYLI